MIDRRLSEVHWLHYQTTFSNATYWGFWAQMTMLKLITLTITVSDELFYFNFSLLFLHSLTLPCRFWKHWHSFWWLNGVEVSCCCQERLWLSKCVFKRIWRCLLLVAEVKWCFESETLQAEIIPFSKWYFVMTSPNWKSD